MKFYMTGQEKRWHFNVGDCMAMLECICRFITTYAIIYSLVSHKRGWSSYSRRECISKTLYYIDNKIFIIFSLGYNTIVIQYMYFVGKYKIHVQASETGRKASLSLFIEASTNQIKFYICRKCMHIVFTLVI
jgi:hypothetical protein